MQKLPCESCRDASQGPIRSRNNFRTLYIGIRQLSSRNVSLCASGKSRDLGSGLWTHTFDSGKTRAGEGPLLPERIFSSRSNRNKITYQLFLSGLFSHVSHRNWSSRRDQNWSTSGRQIGRIWHFVSLNYFRFDHIRRHVVNVVHLK